MSAKEIQEEAGRAMSERTARLVHPDNAARLGFSGREGALQVLFERLEHARRESLRLAAARENLLLRRLAHK